MKIGIITFHFAYNYGAVLQAWALQQYLSKLGHEVTIIDYRPYYHTERYAVFRSIRTSYALTYSKTNSIVKSLKSVAGTILDNITKHNQRCKKARYFESFFFDNYNLSCRYLTIEELRMANLNYSLVIAGSDQIWNKKLTDDRFDPAYFIDFGTETMRRVVYAASLGETSVHNCTEYISHLMFPLNMISCREQYDAMMLGNSLQTRCNWVSDPTLLLTSADYSLIEETVCDLPNNYCLVYILKQNKVLQTGVSSMIEHKNKVIDISPIETGIKGTEKIFAYSVGQFLYYIKNATFVITNSFHATIFSLLYGKQFLCGTNGKRNNRIHSILNQVNLCDRMVDSYNDFCNKLNTSIDYSTIEKDILFLSDNGKQFLNEALKYE